MYRAVYRNKSSGFIGPGRKNNERQEDQTSSDEKQAREDDQAGGTPLGEDTFAITTEPIQRFAGNRPRVGDEYGVGGLRRVKINAAGLVQAQRQGGASMATDVGESRHGGAVHRVDEDGAKFGRVGLSLK